MNKYDRFYPGRVWLDTEGKRIQAHGGSVIFIDGVITGTVKIKKKQYLEAESGTGV